MPRPPPPRRHLPGERPGVRPGSGGPNRRRSFPFHPPMSRRLPIGLVLVVLLTTGLVAGILTRQQVRVPVPLAAGLPGPSASTGGGRIWRPFPGRETATRPLGPPAGSPGPGGGTPAPDRPAARDLVRPGLLTGGPGALYLVDYQDLLIKRLSPDTLEVTGIFRPPPAATGEEPAWQTVQVMDLAVEGGELWAADAAGHQVLVFDAGGDLARRLPLEPGPLRLAATGNGRFTALQPDGGEQVYGSYGPRGEPLHRAGPLLDPGLQMPFTLDGILVPDGIGGFLHVLRNRNLLAAWDEEGNLRYLVHPVAARPPPPMLRDGSGILRGDPDAPLGALDAAVQDGALYVLTTEDGTPATSGVIDVYSVADGTYRHSWRLPGRPHDLALTDGRLATLGSEGLRVYDWP